MWGDVECVCIITGRIIRYLLPAWCVRILTTKLLTAGSVVLLAGLRSRWKSICRQFLSRLEFSPFPAIFAFTSLCLRQAGRRQPRHRDSCAARRQIRHSNHQVLSGSWFSPRRQYFTPWQPPAACMCWWCSDVSIIAEVQKHSGCQNILNSFIISAKKQLLWDNKVICLGGFILINHVHLFRCATLATETGRYMSDKINF